MLAGAVLEESAVVSPLVAVVVAAVVVVMRGLSVVDVVVGRRVACVVVEGA